MKVYWKSMHVKHAKVDAHYGAYVMMHSRWPQTMPMRSRIRSSSPSRRTSGGGYYLELGTVDCEYGMNLGCTRLAGQLQSLMTEVEAWFARLHGVRMKDQATRASNLELGTEAKQIPFSHQLCPLRLTSGRPQAQVDFSARLPLQQPQARFIGLDLTPSPGQDEATHSELWWDPRRAAR